MRVAESAASRALEAFLRSRGVQVKLRVALPASAGDHAEQLGLASPEFDDREIGLGVFRKTGGSRVLLLEARAGEALAGEAAGLVVGGELFAVESREALRDGESVYGWAVRLGAASGGAHA